MVESVRNCNVSCKSHTYMVVNYLCFGKHGRRKDNNFEGRVAMKSNLQPQVLQGKLVMLTFKSNTVLSTKICLEYWLR